jgi:hypothetical protein
MNMSRSARKSSPSVDAEAPAGGEQSGILQDGPTEALATMLLDELRRENCRPHCRILSQRKLAERFGVPPVRVYRAIARLKKRGYLYARRGSGVFLGERAPAKPASGFTDEPAASPRPLEAALDGPSFAPPHVPLFKTLRLSFPAQASATEMRMWGRGIAAFRREFPFLRIETDCRAAQTPAACDVAFITPWTMRARPADFAPLKTAHLRQGGLSAERLIEGILALGRLSHARGLFGLPLLRTTTLLAADRQLLETCDLTAASVQTPSDLFRIGAAMEAAGGSRVMGFNFVGYAHYGAFYGVDFRERNGGFAFDRDRMTRLLLDLKPHIRPHHFDESQNSAEATLRRFLQGKLGFLCYYWHQYPALQRAGSRLSLVKLPVLDGGYVGEGAALGCVPRTAAHKEEAMLFLGFLASEAAQTLLVAEAPHWLAVHAGVLQKQETASPFPPGSIVYRFDPRPYCTPMKPQIGYAHNRKVNTEIAKFFMNLQGLEETLRKIGKRS